MNFGRVKLEDGTTYYVVLWNPDTGKHKPISDHDLDYLLDEREKERKFDELRERILHPKYTGESYADV